MWLFADPRDSADWLLIKSSRPRVTDLEAAVILCQEDRPQWLGCQRTLLFFPNARHRLNMFLEFSGILALYAGPGPKVASSAVECLHSCVAWFCLRSDSAASSSCCQRLNLAQLLALILGHCHRYKTGFLLLFSTGQEASVAHFSNIRPALASRLCGFATLQLFVHYRSVCISIWFRVKFTHDL